MKRGSGTQKAGRRARVTWDETNLMENEILQAELNPMKIDEPKTPYRSPLCTDEESELDRRSKKVLKRKKKSDALAEEQDGGQDKRNSPQEAAHQEYLLHRETGDENGRRSVDEYYNTDDVPEDEVQEDEEEKKKQFLEARKMHYKISKNILSNPVESDEEKSDFQDNSTIL